VFAGIVGPAGMDDELIPQSNDQVPGRQFLVLPNSAIL
jgi:hypothetical protein